MHPKIRKFLENGGKKIFHLKIGLIQTYYYFDRDGFPFAVAQCNEDDIFYYRIEQNIYSEEEMLRIIEVGSFV